MSAELSPFLAGDVPAIPSNEEIRDIDQLFDQLDEQLAGYTGSLQAVKNATRMILSPERIGDYARVYCDDFDDNDRLNRNRERIVIRTISESAKLSITNAKFRAQQYADPDLPEDKKKQIEEERKESDEPAEGKDPFKAILSKDWAIVFDSELERTRQEAAIRNILETFLAANDTNVLEFIKRVEELDPSEYAPLFSILHKDIEDPFVAGVVVNAAYKIQENPEIYKDEFLDRIDDEGQAQPELELSDSVQSWLGWIATQDILKSSLSELLFSLPTEHWPQPLREEFGEYAQNTFASLWNRYKELVSDYKNPSIATVSVKELDDMVERYQNPNALSGGKRPGKRSKSKGSRITKKVNMDKYIAEPEYETIRLFNTVTTLIKTPGGWMPKDNFEIDDTSTIEAFAQVPLVQKYLEKYASDPSIAEDLYAMLDSILREPYFNGTSKLRHQSINYTETRESYAVSLPIWHLNPNKRSGLSIGNIGRKTRIYYSIHPDKASRQLFLIDIAHKNGAEMLSNTTFRRTS